MGAESAGTKRAQREICLPPPQKKIVPRLWDTGPEASQAVSGWGQGRSAGLHLQEAAKGDFTYFIFLPRTKPAEIQ